MGAIICKTEKAYIVLQNQDGLWAIIPIEKTLRRSFKYEYQILDVSSNGEWIALRHPITNEQDVFE